MGLLSTTNMRLLSTNTIFATKTISDNPNTYDILYMQRETAPTREICICSNDAHFCLLYSIQNARELADIIMQTSVIEKWGCGAVTNSYRIRSSCVLYNYHTNPRMYKNRHSLQLSHTNALKIADAIYELATNIQKYASI